MRGYEDSKVPRLFELMEMRKIKATQLSKETGITTGSITDWKRGKSIPTGSRLVALCQYFNVTAAELLGIEVSDEVEKMVVDEGHHFISIDSTYEYDAEKIRKLVDDVLKLSKEQQNEIIDYVSYVKYKTEIK